MEIVKMKCPHCGAEMDLNEERTEAFCSYCGSRVYVDTESAQDEAYEARQRKRTERLVNQLDEIEDGIREEDRIEKKLQAAKEKCSSTESELKELKKRKRNGILCVLGIDLFFICAVFGYDIGIVFQVLIVMTFILLGAGICRLMRRHYKAKQSKCSAELSECRKNEESVRYELRDAKDAYDPSLLPAQYRHALGAIEFFKKMLLAGRAHNLEDAVLLYEENCHRKSLEQKLELQQIQMMNLQKSLDEKNKARAKQGANETDGSDLLGAAAAVGTVVVGAKILKDIGKHLL